MLNGKTLILGVTGGIAAYKAVELLRLYSKAGADVHVIMTASAQQFVTPLTFQTLSGNPVHTELFNLYREREIGHISLADRADLFVIAPATANMIGKVANGIADDMLSTTIMATKAPVLFAPAMNVNMYENPVYQQNELKLKELGYQFVEPDKGYLACGWEGKGKLPDPQCIYEATNALLSPNDFEGQTVLVTAGPTRENIDPVRFVSNYSSGKMGYAIASAARDRGGKVVLVTGPTCLQPPRGIEVETVVTASEMYERVMAFQESADIIIKAAAVADYRPKEQANEKIKKQAGVEQMTLEMEKNPDILAALGRSGKKNFLVGFAAETSDLINNAQKKLIEKKLDMIVANDVSQAGAGFNVDTNVVRFLYRNGETEQLPQLMKDEVAHALLDRIARQLSE